VCGLLWPGSPTFVSSSKECEERKVLRKQSAFAKGGRRLAREVLKFIPLGGRTRCSHQRNGEYKFGPELTRREQAKKIPNASPQLCIINVAPMFFLHAPRLMTRTRVGSGWVGGWVEGAARRRRLLLLAAPAYFLPSLALASSAPTSYSRVDAFYFACFFFHSLNFVERPASDCRAEFVQPRSTETEFHSLVLAFYKYYPRVKFTAIVDGKF
jgi:hypothetical protein